MPKLQLQDDFDDDNLQLPVLDRSNSGSLKNSSFGNSKKNKLEEDILFSNSKKKEHQVD